MSGAYDIAQICLNGHLIIDRSKKFPERQKIYCEKCGEKTISNCPSCDSEIKGEYVWDNGWPSGQFQRHFPYFCDNCGSQFPWTVRKIIAIEELIKELKLPKKEKTLLSASLDDLLRETPNTPIAVIRWKKVLSKVEATMYDLIRQVFLDFVSGTVKKSLFGN